jgi:hypothetical protein
MMEMRLKILPELILITILKTMKTRVEVIMKILPELIPITKKHQIKESQHPKTDLEQIHIITTPLTNQLNLQKGIIMATILILATKEAVAVTGLREDIPNPPLPEILAEAMEEAELEAQMAEEEDLGNI